MLAQRFRTNTLSASFASSGGAREWWACSLRAQPRRREAAPHRRHGVVYEEISQHRAAEGPADERCLTAREPERGRSAKPKMRKILDTTVSLRLALVSTAPLLLTLTS